MHTKIRSKEDLSKSLLEYTGPGAAENPCVMWRNLCLLALVTKNCPARFFLCGLCAIHLQEKCCFSDLEYLSSVKEADNIDKYGCK